MSETRKGLGSVRTLSGRSTQRSAVGRLRSSSLLAWFLWILYLLLTLAGAILLFLSRSIIRDLVFPGFFAGVILAVGYGTVGLLIAANRPRHPIGWLFMGMAGVAALFTFAEMYAVYGLLVAPDPLPGARLAGWLQIWLIYLVFPAPIALLAILYPDGKLPSSRWRPVAVLAILSTLILALSEMISTDPVFVYITERPLGLPMSNPTGSEALARIRHVLSFDWLLAVIILPVGLFAPIFRFRRAGGAERQQLKWFVYFGAFTLLLFPLAFVGGETVGNLVLGVSITILPAATAVAILRHQLYDIDLIIKRTLLYAVLSSLLALIYFGSVALLQNLFTAVTGQSSAVAIVLSTLLIAAMFTPLRRRVQDLIDRRFYRQKYDAAKTLADFAQAARDEVDLEALSADLLRVVERTMQPERLGLWLRTTTDSRRPTTEKAHKVLGLDNE